MAFHPPEKVAEIALKAGIKKANMSISSTLILGFLAGAYIALGFMLTIRVTGNLPDNIWGSFGSFIGASVFPVGLILILIAGGELVTGNMMAVASARFSRKVTSRQIVKNWTLVTVSNFIGAVFVAYFFGHYLGITEGDFLEKTVAIAGAKLDDSFMQAFVSGMGANWLVCLAIWLNFAAKDVAGKILGIWLPVMTFVSLGFQHVVANMFVIPAAIMGGHYTWGAYFANFVPVWLGNAIGGTVFVGLLYWISYSRKKEFS